MSTPPPLPEKIKPICRVEFKESKTLSNATPFDYRLIDLQTDKLNTGSIKTRKSNSLISKPSIPLTTPSPLFGIGNKTIS